MVTTIQGFVLIDTWAAALNNAGVQPSERTDNIVRTKVFWRGRQPFPYVSGQSWRYWWRNLLGERKDWKLSPINRETKIAYTEANPLTYPDDDIFGYMRAPKSLKDKAGKKVKSVTLTRASTLKNTPLIAVGSQRPTEDFGTFSRLEGDPVPYEHEFYSTILKGMFSLDVDSAGVFKTIASAGSQNLPPDFEIPSDFKDKCKQINSNFVLDKETRVQRIVDVISVLPHLTGGAMQARHLERVAPSLLILGTFTTGSHLFAHLAKTENGFAAINIEALKQILQDYEKDLLTKLYIGRQEGFLDEQADAIKEFAEEFKGKVVLGSIASVTQEFCNEIPGLVK